MSDFSADSPYIRDEAKRWYQLAGRMGDTKSDVVNLKLAVSAFWAGELLDVDSVTLHSSYQGFVTYMTNLLSGAVTEFDAMGDALKRTADAYDDNEDDAALNLDNIFRD